MVLIFLRWHQTQRDTDTFHAVATYFFSFLSFFFFFFFFLKKSYWNDYCKLVIDVCDRIFIKNNFQGGRGLSDKKSKNNKWEGDYYLELESI